MSITFNNSNIFKHINNIAYILYCRNHRHYKLKFQLLLFNAYDINNIKPYFWSRMWDLHLSGLGPCSTGSDRYYLSGPFQGPKYKMQCYVHYKSCHTCINSGSIVFWLRGHKSETVSLLWPRSLVLFEEPPTFHLHTSR